jgi:TRAP-type C4-dicarboxylate transport system permease small subunit
MSGPRIVGYAFRALEFALAACLVVMVLMVLGNVVLRYTLNSGILVSEEMSRFLFVWLTFVGAVIAAREGSHLGVDTLVSRLPRGGKVFCLVVSEILILGCCAVLFWGTWQQMEINATNVAPVTGLPMSWVYGVSLFTSIGIGAIVVHKLWRIATGRLTDAELVQIRESEDPGGVPEAPPDPGAIAADVSGKASSGERR